MNAKLDFLLLRFMRIMTVFNGNLLYHGDKDYFCICLHCLFYMQRNVYGITVSLSPFTYTYTMGHS
jgi:hypothetical protein